MRIGWFTLAVLTVVVAGCGREVNRDSGGKMLAAASIGPLGCFAREVGGNLMDVTVLVPPGASPHTYQLTSDQMKLMNRASVLVLNGVGLEFWADKVVQAADNPRLVVVRAAEGLRLIGSGNPHVWLSPTDAIHQVNAIRDAFAKADPPHARDYTRNADAYIVRLRGLDKEIRAEVATFKHRKFVAFHPAWVYFARDYGLQEAAVIEDSPGKEPSPKHVREVIDTARKLRAKAIFAEPQLSPKPAEVIANETGARVLFLNPIGKPPLYDYVENMRANVRQMAKALR